MGIQLTTTEICNGQNRTQKLGRFALFMKAIRIYNQRQCLLKLTQTELNDIGITADDARAEAHRKFWDIDDV